MRVNGTALCVALVALGAASAVVVGQTPSIPPSISRVNPPGARRGTQVTLAIEGRNLAGVRKAWFDTPGLEAKFLSVTDLPEEHHVKDITETPIPLGRRQEAKLRK